MSNVGNNKLLCICNMNKDTLYSRYISGDIDLLHDIAEHIDEVHGSQSIQTHSMGEKGVSLDELAQTHVRYVQSELKRAHERVRQLDNMIVNKVK